MKSPFRHIFSYMLTLIMLAISLGAAGPVAAGEISPDLAMILSQASAVEEIPIIVQLKNKVNLRQFRKFKKKLRRAHLLKALKEQAKTDQADVEALLKKGKNRKLKKLWLINGIAVDATPELIQKLSALKAVETIRLDRVVPMAAPTPAESGTPSWNLSMIQTDVLWNLGFQGQGVVIANMDTGVDALNTALSGSYRGGTNSWYDPYNEHAAPFDIDGHGTQSMGVLVGSGGMGVAPMAQWIAVKIFDDAGLATLSGIHSGFQWLLDPDNDPTTDDAPDIVNNSWGLVGTVNQCVTEFETDIETLRTADIAVIFSGGNSGPSAYTSLSPANNTGSLAVGAVDSNADALTLSSTGPSACSGGIYPQLTAPGLSIFTAGLTYNGIFPDMTTYASGTSFSAPHVSGAMALLRSAFPDASVAELEQALWDSALDLGPTGPDDSYGHGLVRAADAFDLLNTGSPTEPQCIDTDDDGFFSATSDVTCGGPVDCEDSNPDIYPGAPEITRDGIDQDCNGHDLTIRVNRAVYLANQDRIVIFARSASRADAALRVDIPGIGIRSMTWNKTKKRWQRSINHAARKGFNPFDPGLVVVQGPEGEVSFPVTVKKMTAKRANWLKRLLDRLALRLNPPILAMQ
jgi:serine protease AprX